MTLQMVLDLAQRGLNTALITAAPMFATAVVVGVLINVIQTITSVRDTSLTFVPKAVATVLVMGLTLPWGLGMLIGFCAEMFAMLPAMGR